MPNWCNNRYTFIGTKEEIDDIQSKVWKVVEPNEHTNHYKLNEDGKAVDFDFNGIIPMPTEINTGGIGSHATNTYDLMKKDGDNKIISLDFLYQWQWEKLQAKEINIIGMTISEYIKMLRDDVKLAHDLGYDFEMADKFMENKEKYGYENWYDWSIAKWGTKWNACEHRYFKRVELEDGRHQLSGEYSTAWSPSIPVINEIAKRYPNVEIVYRYAELGCDFCGEMESDNNGNMIECEVNHSADYFAYEYFNVIDL